MLQAPICNILYPGPNRCRPTEMMNYLGDATSVSVEFFQLPSNRYVPLPRVDSVFLEPSLVYVVVDQTRSGIIDVHGEVPFEVRSDWMCFHKESYCILLGHSTLEYGKHILIFVIH